MCSMFLEDPELTRDHYAGTLLKTCLCGGKIVHRSDKTVCHYLPYNGYRAHILTPYSARTLDRECYCGSPLVDGEGL